MENWLPRPFAASKVHIMRELTLAMLLLGLTAIGGWAQNQHLDQSSADESGNTIAASPNNQKISVTMSTLSPEPPYVIGIDDILQHRGMEGTGSDKHTAGPLRWHDLGAVAE